MIEGLHELSYLLPLLGATYMYPPGLLGRRVLRIARLDVLVQPAFDTSGILKGTDIPSQV